MRKTVLIASLLGSASLVFATMVARIPAGDGARGPTAVHASAGGVHFRGVRAEWARQTFVVDDITTVLRIMNRSLTQPLALENVVFVGPGGVGSVISVYGFQSRVVPPLGEVILPIGYNINGLSPRGTRVPGAGDLTNAFVSWTGPVDAMRLTALITNSTDLDPRYKDYQSMVVAESFVVTQ